MDTRCMIGLASRFKDAGTPAQACSIGWRARSLNGITTGATSQLFICLWKGCMWVKPTVPSSWAVEAVAWEATARRKNDREKAKAAASETQQVRTGMQEEIEATKKQRRRTTR